MDMEVMLEENRYQTFLSELSSTYDVSKDAVQYYDSLVKKYAYSTFPTREIVLSVIIVESKFDNTARGPGGAGLMQINPLVFRLNNFYDPEENIRKGVSILREYYKKLGDPKSAVLAYNAGIGNFLHGNFNTEYWDKVKSVKGKVEDLE